MKTHKTKHKHKNTDGKKLHKAEDTLYTFEVNSFKFYTFSLI